MSYAFLAQIADLAKRLDAAEARIAALEQPSQAEYIPESAKRGPGRPVGWRKASNA